MTGTPKYLSKKKSKDENKDNKNEDDDDNDQDDGEKGGELKMPKGLINPQIFPLRQAFHHLGMSMNKIMNDDDDEDYPVILDTP